MKKIIFQFIISCLFIAFVSCNKDNGSEYSVKAIVEAYLSPDNTVCIHITKEILYTSSDTAVGIDNLNVKIRCNDTDYFLTPTGNGYYTADSSLKIKEGNTYDLEFEYINNVVTSTTIIPSKPTGYTESASSIAVQQFNPGSSTMPLFPDPIELDWDNSNHDYYIIVVNCTETNPTPTDTVNENKRSFRTEPTQSNTYKLQAMQFKYYGTHQIILYKLNPEYAALYNDNGSNSLNLTSPESNINNGWGIFTGINADTLTVEVTN
jgi:hypothetical protein